MEMFEMDLFVNDDADRTFLSVQVGSGKAGVVSLIRAVDTVLLLHDQQPFHEVAILLTDEDV